MPARTRQRVLTFTSPDLRDLFFWEHVTLSRKDHTALVADTDYAYGTPHPETANYPSHKLVYLEHDPDFQDGGNGQDSYQYKAYYVADREDQDKYNFEFGSADFGGKKFDVVRRSYITLRSAWNESTPAAGAAMSTEPASKFPSGYVMVDRNQQRIGQRELDALYVVEQRTYVKKVSLKQLGFDELSGRQLSTTTEWFYRGETVADTGLSIEALAERPGHPYWTVAIDPTETLEDGFTVTAPDAPDVEGTYIAVDGFTIDGKVYYTNDGAAVGGTTTRYIYWSSPDNSWLAVSVGGFEVTELESTNETDYPSDASWQLFGGGDTTVTFSGGIALYGQGVIREVQQVSEDWWVVQSKGVVSGLIDGTALILREYPTSVNFFWPPVLNVLEFMDWVRIDGGVEVYPRTEMSPEGYRGPCGATITQRWSVDPVTPLTAEQFNPRGVNYASPYFRLNLPACLHPDLWAKCDTGNTDPVYDQNVNSQREFEATNYTVWPTSIVSEDEQRPYRGGYLRTIVEVDQPDHATPATSNIQGYVAP